MGAALDGELEHRHARRFPGAEAVLVPFRVGRHEIGCRHQAVLGGLAHARHARRELRLLAVDDGLLDVVVGLLGHRQGFQQGQHAAAGGAADSEAARRQQPVPGHRYFHRIGLVELARPGIGAWRAVALHDAHADGAERVPGNAQAVRIDRGISRVVGRHLGRIRGSTGRIVGVGRARRGAEEVDGVDQSGPEHRRVDIGALLPAWRFLVGAALAARVECQHYVALAHQQLRRPPVSRLRRLDRAVLDHHAGQGGAGGQVLWLPHLAVETGAARVVEQHRLHQGFAGVEAGAIRPGRFGEAEGVAVALEGIAGAQRRQRRVQRQRYRACRIRRRLLQDLLQAGAQRRRVLQRGEQLVQRRRRGQHPAWIGEVPRGQAGDVAQALRAEALQEYRVRQFLRRRLGDHRVVPRLARGPVGGGVGRSFGDGQRGAAAQHGRKRGDAGIACHVSSSPPGSFPVSSSLPHRRTPAHGLRDSGLRRSRQVPPPCRMRLHACRSPSRKIPARSLDRDAGLRRAGRGWRPRPCHGAAQPRRGLAAHCRATHARRRQLRRGFLRGQHALGHRGLHPAVCGRAAVAPAPAAGPGAGGRIALRASRRACGVLPVPGRSVPASTQRRALVRCRCAAGPAVPAGLRFRTEGASGRHPGAALDLRSGRRTGPGPVRQTPAAVPLCAGRRRLLPQAALRFAAAAAVGGAGLAPPFPPASGLA